MEIAHNKTINYEKLKTYFNTPRSISDAFDITTSSHRGFTLGFRIKAISLCSAVIFAIAAYQNFTTWYTVAIFAVGWGIGELMCKKYKAEALEWGKKELSTLPASFAGLIQWNETLFQDPEIGFGYSIIIYSTDGKTAENEKTIREITYTIRGLRSKASTADEKYVAEKLNDKNSYFSEEMLNPSLTGGVANVFWKVELLYRRNFPYDFDPEQDLFLLFVDSANNPKYVLPKSLY